MWFSLNGRSSKLDFDDIQSVDDCSRTGNQDGGYKPKAGMKNLGLSFCTRYQRESQNRTGIFVVEEHKWTHVNTVQCRCKSQIENGRQKPEVERNNAISQLPH